MTTSAPDIHPHALTGGWNTSPLVRVSIDWMDVTFPQDCQVPRPDWMARDSVEVKPMNAYDRAIRYSDGRTELTHSRRADMGTHVMLPGGVMACYQERARELLDIYVTGRGRFSRLDLAVDVFNMPGFTPQRAHEEIVAGRCSCRARAYPRWDDSVLGGYTQYCGAPASERRVRIYDKAAETRLDDLAWTRVEGQYRGKPAHGAAMAMTGGADEREILRGYVDFPEWEEWKRVFRLPAVRVPTVKQETNTERWLLAQVAPALARQVRLSGPEFLDRFVSAYERELARHEASQPKSGL